MLVPCSSLIGHQRSVKMDCERWDSYRNLIVLNLITKSLYVVCLFKISFFPVIHFIAFCKSIAPWWTGKLQRKGLPQSVEKPCPVPCCSCCGVWNGRGDRVWGSVRAVGKGEDRGGGPKLPSSGSSQGESLLSLPPLVQCGAGIVAAFL